MASCKMATPSLQNLRYVDGLPHPGGLAEHEHLTHQAIDHVLQEMASLPMRKRYADCLRGNFEAMIEMAAADPLTGLKNRRYLEVHLAALVEQSRGGSLCAMILDLDEFKKVNDRHGHAAGDHVLMGFAALAKEVIHRSGVLCRLGDDEFAAVMPGTDLCAGIDIAETIRASVTGCSLAIAGGDPVSVGLAERAGDSCAGLLRRADMARRKRPAAIAYPPI